MKTLLLSILALLPLHHASAVAYTISWLDMSATPVAGAVGNPSAIYNLPGYGNVQVSYTSTTLNWTREAGALLQNGSTVAGADGYSWNNFHSVNAVNFAAGNSPPLSYNITFTLLNGPMPAGQLVLGSAGLGHSTAAGFTDVIVIQNATFLNDHDLGAGFGPTSFTGGVGSFTLRNSLAEPTPGFFNSDLGVTRIDDSVSSLTLRLSHIGQDGIGFGIGMINPVPEPGTAALASLGALALLSRRAPRRATLR